MYLRSTIVTLFLTLNRNLFSRTIQSQKRITSLHKIFSPFLFERITFFSFMLGKIFLHITTWCRFEYRYDSVLVAQILNNVWRVKQIFVNLHENYCMLTCKYSKIIEMISGEAGQQLDQQWNHFFSYRAGFSQKI